MIGVFYSLARCVWAYTTYFYFEALKANHFIFDIEVLKEANLLRGVGALTGGFFAVLFCFSLIRFFKARKKTMGVAGGYLTIFLTLSAVLAKTLTLYFWPFFLSLLALILLTAKSLGILLMGMSLLSR